MKKKKNEENRDCLPIIARGILCNVNRHQGRSEKGRASRSPPLNSVGAGKTPCSSKQRLRVHHGISAHVRHDNI